MLGLGRKASRAESSHEIPNENTSHGGFITLGGLRKQNRFKSYLQSLDALNQAQPHHIDTPSQDYPALHPVRESSRISKRQALKLGVIAISGIVILSLVSLLGLRYVFHANAPSQQDVYQNIALNTDLENPETTAEAQEQNMLALADQSPTQQILSAEGQAQMPVDVSLKQEPVFGLLQLETPKPDNTQPTAKPELVMGGSGDPFAPILDNYQAAGPDGEKERDVLDSVQFTGFIDDIQGKKKVAILKISDPAGDYSLVKKTKDSFSIEGKKIIVQNVKNDMLYVTVDGTARTLMLNAFNVAASSNSGNSTSTGNAAATTLGAPSTTPANGSILGQAPAGAGSVSNNSANNKLKLEE